MNQSYEVVLKEIGFLRPSEEIDVAYAATLAGTIASCRIWLKPLPVEREIGLVMDGNHRLHAGRLLGLSHLPCIFMDYADPRVSVECWRTGVPFALDRLRYVVASHELLPYKTTRHVFRPALPTTHIPLKELRRRARDKTTLEQRGLRGHGEGAAYVRR